MTTDDKSISQTQGELVRRSYSDEEVATLYELGRFCLENGDTRRAEAIMYGLNEVAPDFCPAWLGTCCIQVLGKTLS